MKSLSHAFLPLSLLALPGLVGCASRSAGAGEGVVPAQAQAEAEQPRVAAKPTVAPQFTEVADADWTIAAPAVGRERACQDGKVLAFDCQDVDLLSFLPTSAIGGGQVSSLWAWIDSTTNREFIIVGRSTGTSFVEVTDPLNPRYLGNLPVHAGARPAIWHDAKVYKNHAFIVSDGSGRHGMQIFDLTQLRDVTDAPVEFTETAHYDKVASVHTIALNEETGFVYNTGVNGGGESCGGGLHMVDVRNPTEPVFAGCYAEPKTGRRGTGYIHETVCLIYRGPDADYKGKEICMNASETALGVSDVTDKANPTTISIATYPNVRYAHQGWFTEDQRYFFLNDELDDGVGGVAKTRTIVFDMIDLDDPVMLTEFYGPTAATDHNLYIRGRYMYQSNYSAGLRVIDVKDPANLAEVAYFDTYPQGNAAGFVGTWTNFPYFLKNGVVAVTGIGEGIFMVRHRLKADPS